MRRMAMGSASLYVLGVGGKGGGVEGGLEQNECVVRERVGGGGSYI